MPGAGCSITPTATVSTAGCFIRRTTFGAAFFTVTRLGLALATVRFVGFPRAALATLRALPRVAEFPLCGFARFCTLDRFLRWSRDVLLDVQCTLRGRLSGRPLLF